MIVMLTIVELKNRFSTIKLTARQNASLFKLCQDTVYRCQTYFYAFTYQHTVNILGTEVTLTGTMKDVQDFKAGKGGFEANIFKIALVVFGLQGSPLAYSPYSIKMR